MKNLVTFLPLFYSFSMILAQNNVDIQKSLEDIIKAERQRHEVLYDFEASGVGQNYDVKYHRFQWTVDPSVRRISGAVTTYFKALSALSEIGFDLDAVLKVDSVIHRGTKAIFSQNATDKTLRITPNLTIQAGVLDSVTVFYAGVPPNTGFGSYNQRLRNNTTPETWTLSEPYGARDWWPGKMDLTDKIDSIDVIVTTPPQYRVASNGILVREINVDANNKLYHWKHRYPIANYLVCFAVTNFDQYIDKAPLSRGDTMSLLNYVYPESKAASQQWSWKCADAMRLYDSLFIEYPFKKEKYGHAMFGWGGGMEHQTMSFMVNITDAGLMAHELAHQWFGDRVTCGSWSDIWLNESFATYLTGLYYQYVEPLYWRNWRTSTLGSATSITSGSVFCTDTTDINRIFSGQLSYNKGAYVLHTLRWKVGDTAFFKGLRNYLNDPALAYSFARTADLKRHLEASSGQNLTEFFNDYFFGQGYPSYTLTGCQGDVLGQIQINIKQTSANTSVPFFEMPIPVKLISKRNGKDTIVVLNVNNNDQYFNVSHRIGIIDSVAFDPELQILSKNNKVNWSLCLPTQDIDEQWLTSLSPNPANSLLNFSFHNDRMEMMDIQIVNTVGQVLKSEPKTILAGENSLQISVKDLPNGTYFLKITTVERTSSRKFVISH
ncbi:MAG: T9SS type A sorting domain-containing protein [Saprospiraceae bacterium]|nr:T9SS type A sorting domain-containing protein [Saprospiraceae bacterium]